MFLICRDLGSFFFSVPASGLPSIARESHAVGSVTAVLGPASVGLRSCLASFHSSGPPIHSQKAAPKLSPLFQP